MWVEFGHFALILALCLALVQGILPLWGARRQELTWMSLAIPLARLQLLCLSIALLGLAWAFLQKDFSVAYVAQNSNSILPWYYRISAVWGAHEGSLLLWAWILAVWTAAVTWFSRSLPLELLARVLAVLGWISTGFLLFLIITSNPFTRLLPAPLDGNDLNPLLQDFGLIVHPPMLYMGYVGLAIPFAFAVAALLMGQVNTLWTRWVRPWTTVAWVFLTLGIALGSWWAYYELGWGGWWFWDPVENASFMPWLVATALIHSLAVTEQRDAFKSWSLLLAIFGFSLSLLGTFLVRSGILVSVHAFATDPTRGVFVLVFLGLVIGIALFLYAWRAHSIIPGGQFALLSRETLLLLNNVLLVAAAGTILLGTLYPLLVDALQLGKISVGPPYFNRVFVPLMLPLVLLLGFGPITRWKQDTASGLFSRIYKAVITAALLALMLILFYLGPSSWQVALGLTLAVWVMVSTLYTGKIRIQWDDIRGSLRRLPIHYVGMFIAHIGVGIFIIGVTIVSVYEQALDARMAPGDQAELAGYTFTMEAINNVQGPNYQAVQGVLTVKHGDDYVTTLRSEKRIYSRQENAMTEAGIDAGLFRDLYASLGEPLTDGAWSVRLHYKPFVRWIWLGALLMALGGLITVFDRRYRQTVPVTAG